MWFFPFLQPLFVWCVSCLLFQTSAKMRKGITDGYRRHYFVARVFHGQSRNCRFRLECRLSARKKRYISWSDKRRSYFWTTESVNLWIFLRHYIFTIQKNVWPFNYEQFYWRSSVFPALRLCAGYSTACFGRNTNCIQRRNKSTSRPSYYWRW